MSKRISRVVMMAVAFIVVIISSVSADVIQDDQQGKEKKPNYVPGQIIVKFKSETNSQTLSAQTETRRKEHLSAKHKVKNMKRLFADLEAKGKKKGKSFITAIEQAQEIKAKFPKRAQRELLGAKTPNLEDIYVIELEDSEADVITIAREYSKDPEVEYAEPNYICEINWIPNDPYYSSSNSWGQGYDDLWGLKKIQCAGAWDITQGENVVVAVVDTGIDYNHADIASNMWTNTGEIAGNGIDDDNNGYIDDVRGYDFAYTDNDPKDGYGHGTHVAGTIAAVGNNSIGVIGVAPKTKVMAVKGLGDSGSGGNSALANCLIYAADNGADVINNSWGGSSSQVITDAVNYAHSLGCVVVAAAGNSNADASGFSPANIPNVITVAASDQNDVKCYFSNYGTKIDVSAPGGNGSSNPYNILSLLSSTHSSSLENYIVGTNYLRLAGTSMAAPHVSGVAALMVAHHPEYTNEDVRQVMRASADDVGDPGFDINTGYGRVNALNAVNVGSLLYISQSSFKEVEGDADGLYDPGEVIEYTFTLKALNQDAYNVSATLSSQDQYVTIEQNTANWGVILKGKTVDNNATPFSFKIAADCPGWRKISFTVSIAATGYTRNESFSIIVTDPRERRITYDLQRQQDPKISGNRIVWADYRNSTTNLIQPDIYLYDLSTNTERQITSNIGSEASPAISGDRIVWVDYRNGNWDIYMYDLSTNTERQITTNTAEQTFPEISGNYIVWQDKRNNNYAIYMYDLSTNTERQIIANTISQPYPDISGNNIVWMDGRNCSYDPDIYLYDLTTNTERRITTTGGVSSPAISGERIVWQDSRNYSYYNIYMYDLVTNTERRITSTSSALSPAISGDRIVWEDNRNHKDWGENNDIYMYDLATNTERQITSKTINMVYGGEPAISGDRIVWQDYRNGNLEIYMYDLGDITPPSIPVVTDGGSTTTSTTTLTANWTSSDPESAIAEYQYQITADTITGTVIKDWTSTGTTASVTATGLTLQQGKTYYFAVKAKNEVNLWSKVGYSDGITVQTVDTTAPATPIVTDDGIYTTTSTALKAGFTSTDAESGIAEYQYKITRDSTTGTIIKNWTSVGTNTSVNVTGLSLVNGVRYYFSIKAKNGAGLWSAIGYSDGIKVDTTASSTPAVTDGGTYTAKSTSLYCRWSSYDGQSGIAEYQYRITQDSTTGTIIKNWTSVDTTTSITVTGLTLQQGKTYYFSVNARNGAGLWSVIGYSNGIKVDTTAPSKPVVTDGGSTTSSTTTLSASWTSADPESGIAQYQYKITRDTVSGTTIKNWTSTGTTASVTATGLTLVPGKTYYFSVKAKNGALLWSAVGYSDGIKVQ